MSENDDCHCAATTKVQVTSHEKERRKRKAFKRPRKTDIEGVDVTNSAGKARSPTVDSRVRQTVSDDEEVKRSHSPGL